MAAALIVLLAFCILQAGDSPANRWARIYGQALQQFNRGDFDSAWKTAEPSYQYWRNRTDAPWHWPFRLLLAESLIEQDRMGEALPLLQGAAPSAAWEARRLVGMAFVKYRDRKHEAARLTLDAAQAINPPDATDVAGKVDLIRGMMQLRDSQPAEAEACFRRALKAVGGSGSLVESYTLTDLGVGDLRSFRNDEAVAWFDRARTLAQRSGMPRGVMVADSNLGVGFERLGDLDRSVQYLEEATSIAGSLGDHVNLMRVLVTMGMTANELGEREKAEESFEKALGLASPGKDDEWVVTILANLSTIALARADLDAADRLNRRGGEIAGRLGMPMPRLTQQIQAAEIADALRNYENCLRLFAEAADAARLLGDPTGLWQCHAGRASVYRKMGRTADAEREYRIAIGIIEDERSKLTQDEFKLSFLSHLIRFYGDYVDFLIERGDKAGAFRVAQSCRGRLLAEKQNRSGPPSSALDVARLQKAVNASGSTLLSYWLAARRSFVWVMDQSGLQVFALPPEHEISGHVRRYAEALQHGTNPLESGDANGKWLFSHLVPPVCRSRKGGNIIIEPDGALHQLNFESLPVEDGNRFWLDDVTVSVAPALSLLRESTVAQAHKLLLFGDPEFAGTDLPRLPNLKTEMDAVSRNYADKTVYSASAATPASYRSSHPETYSTLHFAAHALANRESPLDSAIILSGPADSRKLYARDILSQPLTAELVTLSACQTAGSRTYYGEGLMGFSWAFLSAGASNVVAGLWPVDDRATAGLMESFYKQLANGLPPAAALRQAKRELIASAAVYRKPRYWASFEIFTRSLYR